LGQKKKINCGVRRGRSVKQESILCFPPPTQNTGEEKKGRVGQFRRRKIAANREALRISGGGGDARKDFSLAFLKGESSEKKTSNWHNILGQK